MSNINNVTNTEFICNRGCESIKINSNNNDNLYILCDYNDNLYMYKLRYSLARQACSGCILNMFNKCSR